jgi:hypothetical protein
MARRSSPEPRPFKRRDPTREMRQRFLIVCEGDTEAVYFDGLKRLRRLTSVVVKAVPAKTSDPAVAVRQASERSETENWDQVWCVFDIEAPPKKSSVPSIDAARAGGLLVAWSNPCFEVWLLLHFQATSPAFEGAKAARVELRRHIPNFEKRSFVTAELLQLAETATQRAKLIKDRHARNGVVPPDDNPNTTVGALVNELLKYAS